MAQLDYAKFNNGQTNRLCIQELASITYAGIVVSTTLRAFVIAGRGRICRISRLSKTEGSIDKIEKWVENWIVTCILNLFLSGS
jgi:hypothetical protein